MTGSSALAVTSVASTRIGESLMGAILPGYALDIRFAHELPDQYTPPNELIEDVLTVGGGSVLYGDSNSGKTFVAIDMACAVARSGLWMGKQTEPGLVIYLAAESPASVLARLQAYQLHYRVKVPNFVIVQYPINLYRNGEDTDKIIELIGQLEARFRRKVRLVIGDTLARLSSGANENTSEDMGPVIERFDRIRACGETHFMLIHHTGKNTAAGMRGWSGVRAAIDTEIEITDSSSGRCIEVTKQRDLGTKGLRMGFELKNLELGKTKWGKVATSCVVIPGATPALGKAKRVSEIALEIIAVLTAHPGGQKKTELIKLLPLRESSAIYRELKKMADAGKVTDLNGIVSIKT